MRCDQFQQRCQELLDDRQVLEKDPMLRAHARVCGQCDEELRIQSLLFGEIERSKVIARRAPRSRKSLWISLALAASVLVLVTPALRHWSDPTAKVWSSSRNGRGVAVRNRAATRGALLAVGTRHPVTRPANGVAMKIAATENSVKSENSLPSPNTPDHEAIRRLVQNMADKWSEVPDEQLEPLDRIAEGFRPLAITLGVAWDALRRTIPVGRAPSVHDPQALFSGPGYQASRA